MQIFFPKETDPHETRAAAVPDNVKRTVKLGASVVIESGLGASLGIADSAYTEAGAVLGIPGNPAIGTGDMILRLGKPSISSVTAIPAGCVHVSYLDPFNERPLVEALARQGVTAISMEMIPRTTVAQKMDALSSQANLGGYEAVIVAAERLNRIFPMMMTPAGTIAPVRVFVIGAGVAGLQAVATAKRLGARVDVFDTRPVVEEQALSLGAKFVKIDLGDTGQTAQGYAMQLTPEQIRKQQEGMAKVCAQSDVVITTAQLFGRKAPRIVTAEMLAGMKPGSVVVDMAVETGGNVEGSKVGEEVVLNGVRIIGLRNLPGRAAADASLVYSNNLYNLVEHFWDKATGSFRLDLSDEILKGCVITHAGEVVNETIRNQYAAVPA